MTRSRISKSGKEDRFTYRTSFERGRKIRQRALDLDEPVEEILDAAVDLYFKDQKTANLSLPKNPREVRYSQKLLHFLRDKEARPGYREILDQILSKYNE